MFPEGKRWLAVVALVVLLGAVAWSYFGGSGTPAPSAPVATGPRRPAAKATSSDPLPPAEAVRLASLPQDRGEPEPAGRNPFRFGAARPAGGATKPAEPAPVFAPPPAVTAGPAGPAAPPPIPLKFIGIVEKGEQKWAVLSAGDGRGPVHGKEGDIIDGRYRILKIGDESIDIVYVDGRGKQTIKLTGQ